MRILITGSNGFIGIHLLEALSNQQVLASDVEILTPSRRELDVLSSTAAYRIKKDFKPTHVLHLAWARTGGVDYDQGVIHNEWSERTSLLVNELAEMEIASWIIGTGLESKVNNFELSSYGAAKLLLKNSLDLVGNSFLGWITMPFIFSFLHRRPRMIKAIDAGGKLRSPDEEHDYLEIRDVAFQLKNLILSEGVQNGTISSDRQTSNLALCSSFLNKKDTYIGSSCSCALSTDKLASSSNIAFTSFALDAT